jgi:hypothetical protein
MPKGRELEVLAAAMRCGESSVRAQLQARGDEDVLRLLPAVERSPELDEALSQFGELLS